MNSKIICRLRQSAVVAAGILGLWGATADAGTFTYTNVDLVAGFRRAGAASDVVVDLGSVSNFEALPLRTVLTLSNVQPSQLAATFPNFNNVSWSISAAMRGNPSYPQYPLQTVWVTSPRASINMSGPVLVRKSQFSEGTTASQVDAIGADAAGYGATVPAGTNNTSSGILITSTDPDSYTTLMTTNGDFSGTFQTDAENATPTNFTTANAVSRSTLYKLLPGSGGTLNTPGSVIGYFDFHPDGTMTFTSGPPPEQVKITSIQISGSTATITFPTVSSVSYRLRFTDALGVNTPASTWNTNSTVIVGDGNVHTLQDTTAGPNARFYAVEAF